MARRIKFRWLAAALLVAVVASASTRSASAKTALIEYKNGQAKVTYSYGENYSFRTSFRRLQYPGYYRTLPVYSYPAYLDHFPRYGGYLYGGW